MNLNFQYQKKLRLTPLGGVDRVTKNMFVYEYGHDILLVDCGMGFPDEPGNDQELLLPDFSYLKNSYSKIRGIVITHAHFDHYGGVPQLLEKVNIPIYTSRLTAEFVKYKTSEYSIQEKDLDIRIIDYKTSNIKIGSFVVNPFHINHSVPESLGLFIKTPQFTICHVSDFKFDFTPVDEKPFDIQKASMLASKERPVLMLSDCLGAAKEGFTDSETAIQEVLENILIRASGLVVITTLSTNISRIKQAIKASANAGRKITFIGRSLEETFNIAKKLGYFANLKKFILPANKIKKYPRNRLTVIAAGSYAQSNSALMKISKNKHHLVKVVKGDVVIFSADPSPPQVIVGVNKMIDDLSKMGVKVFYYEIQDNLHVSGHGIAEDLKMLIAIIKPEYLMPIGGDFRHMAAYASLASSMGYKENKILLLKEKQEIEISSNRSIVVK